MTFETDDGYGPWAIQSFVRDGACYLLFWRRMEDHDGYFWRLFERTPDFEEKPIDSGAATSPDDAWNLAQAAITRSLS